MSPENPQDPQKGKPLEDVQAGQDAVESTQAASTEKAAEKAEAPAPKKPRSRSRAAKASEPEAEGAAASRTGVDKAAVGPARQAARSRQKTKPAVLVSAQAKYVRTSARKARLVCDHIRGKDVQQARAILAFTPRGVARDWSKLLESAVANAEHNHELVGEELRIYSVVADEGPTLKRFRPRAMGRATRIRKRTSHLTITLTPKES
ncbi:MAG: large subunit ribosomal protein [Solirubrobacteraceae bacterium]|jgi:ribosomal protein L22|nr:large subunit ribosomal protein [Solirubrobacteraceae bacterium]